VFDDGELAGGGPQRRRRRLQSDGGPHNVSVEVGVTKPSILLRVTEV
jgi:hypothetical protein